MAGKEASESDWRAAGGEAAPGAHARGLEAAQAMGDEAAGLMQQRLVQVAAERRQDAPQQAGDFRTFQNPDGTITTRFKNGEITFDPSTRPPRPLEYVNLDGDRMKFKYEGDSQKAKSYTLTDKSGKEIESGEKGEKDSTWKIKRSKEGNGPEDKLQNIVDIKITPDGQLDFIEKNGLHHERCRSGNLLRRDSTGRILVEQTPGGRVTEYTYEGKSDQPNTFTVKDAKGNINEHGVSDGKTWSIYKPAAGEASLDPKKLDDPAKKFDDPFDGVRKVSVNQRDGMRVEEHNNGDRTWRDDTREFRQNVSGAMEVVRRTAEGKFQLVSLRDARGVTTKYDYDGKGEVKAETRTYPNGQKHTLERQGETDEWKNSKGETVKVKAKVLEDGSVEMTYLDKKLMLTQTAKGAQLVRRMDPDGQNRLIHSTDAGGREIQYGYKDDGGGELKTMTLSHKYFDEKRQAMAERKVFWEKTGEVDGEETWVCRDKVGERKTADGKVEDVWSKEPIGTFAGTHRINADGTLVRTHKGGKRDIMSVRGITITEQPQVTDKTKK